MQLALVQPPKPKLLKINMKTNNNKLGNPAVINAATSVLPFFLKTLVIGGIGFYVYYKYTNRFISLKENPAYPTSNITNNQATTKAEAIYNAMLGFGNGFEIVKTNMAGLNYNAFVKVYNAFGNRQGSIPFSSKMNLVEWFSDQFNESEIGQLRFLVNNMFRTYEING